MKPLAYYNDNNEYAVEYLNRLINAGCIAPGFVDSRSITEVQPDDLKGFTQCHFFAGLGGWSYAARLAGWPDERPIWTLSCPCQPFSQAGKRKGFDDPRHLWPECKRLIEKRRPPIVFGEQVARASDWIRLVRSDFLAMDFAVGAMPIEAASAGARAKRDRWWFVADAEWNKRPRQESRRRPSGRVGRQLQSIPWDTPWESALARFRIMDDEIPRCVEATDAARNAIDPEVAAQWIGAYLDKERLAP